MAGVTTKPRTRRGAADIAPARDAWRTERTAKTRRGRFRRGTLWEEKPKAFRAEGGSGKKN